MRTQLWGGGGVGWEWGGGGAEHQGSRWDAVSSPLSLSAFLLFSVLSFLLFRALIITSNFHIL